MKLCTWNVNSVRARQDRVLAWLRAHQPDVVCLQEIKVVEELFPYDLIRDVGYHAVVHGQRTYNGVAILSRTKPTDVVCGFGDDVPDDQARLIAATVDGVRVVCVYVPNGDFVRSAKWTYKLEWLRRLRRWLDQACDPDDALALCGDLNIAPEERDTYDPAKWAGTVLFHPSVREAFQDLCDFGLTDSLRIHDPSPGVYSWWDYRRLSFPKKKGMRIDHILVTKVLADRCESVVVDREERGGEKPSDHAPVVATFR